MEGQVMSAAVAGCFPKWKWVMMEPFVFRRDDEESFPDDDTVIGGSGTTSWHAPFRFALQLAKPPMVSRLYAHFPGFPEPKLQNPFGIVSTHRHLVLFRVGMKTPRRRLVQEFFIYSAADPLKPLEPLPPCTRSHINFISSHESDALFAKRRIMVIRSMGLQCRGDPGQEEYAVAELKIFIQEEEEEEEEQEEEEEEKEEEDQDLQEDYKPKRPQICAEICFLRSRGLEWNSLRVPIDYHRGYNDDDALQLYCWELDAVVPSDHGLLYIDYSLGILICDLFGEPTPTVSFLRFPPDAFVDARSYLYRGASVTNAGHQQMLKFVNITRHDGLFQGELQPGTGFTVTCHTLSLGSMEWSKDYTVTSHQLWSLNTPDRLQRTILMLPQVNIDSPGVVHFLTSDFSKYALKTMWVVTIDMYTKKVQSFDKYINGREDLGKKDLDLTQDKSATPTPFIPCDFSKFLNFSRKRKVME